jgi:hypothetical protein
MNSTTTSPAPAAPAAERLHVDHGVTKRLGRWTSASQFDVRVRSGVLVLDLRSPEVTGDQVDHWGLGWSGRGRVKDDQRPAEPGGRRVRLSGRAENSEVRVHRGGRAALSAMFSRAYLQDLRQARKNGSHPTVDDPTRAAR